MAELLLIYTAWALLAPVAGSPAAGWFAMPMHGNEYLWKTIGFLGIGVFQTRFLIQWIYSEKHKESRIPTFFWWQSIVGSLLCLAYFVRQQDPVGVAGYALGFVPYTRNLILMHRKQRRDAGLEAAAGAADKVTSP
jgi:lipid-A-disaccharide synthase-like uncharacterized protein